MDRNEIVKILEDVKNGKTTVEEALRALRDFPYKDIGFAKIDTQRCIRKGFPEVIFCEGKTSGQMELLFRKSAKKSFIMATRANKRSFVAVKRARKDAVYFDKARIIFAGERKALAGKPITVVSAGTADMPVAEEASVTAELMGNHVERVYDIGVAGIHRMFMNTEKIIKANVVIVVAGMEGALASVVGGVVERPVIAVPTSVGYGASFNGLAALLAMLNSCAPGVSVVNIDNGFGAGYIATLINKKR
ncbi:MAG: nickel pincer cofactor biosynthesis protein LarB [Candidatus Omnitrophota bacterium]